MEITDIKQRLTLSEVIKYYGLKADKQNRINCPFHEDKTLTTSPLLIEIVKVWLTRNYVLWRLQSQKGMFFIFETFKKFKNAKQNNK